VRVCFRVDDSVAATATLTAAGATIVAQPTVTPWRSLNARLEAPAGLRLTLFSALPGGDDVSVQPAAAGVR
jgi:lactoylglutathione lyase